MITLVLYIGSLPNLTTWFPCRRRRTLFILGSLGQRSRSPLLWIEFLTTGSFPHNNFSSVYWILTKLGHMIPLWKGKNPIYIDGRILWCTYFLFLYGLWLCEILICIAYIYCCCIFSDVTTTPGKTFDFLFIFLFYYSLWFLWT